MPDTGQVLNKYMLNDNKSNYYTIVINIFLPPAKKVQSCARAAKRRAGICTRVPTTRLG